jgi:type II secretory pathway pseudopilin PulG
MTVLWHNPVRRGISSIEMLVAFSLVLTAMASTVPLFVRHQRLLAESRRERLAIEELANQAQRLLALEPDEVDRFLETLTPSEIARRHLNDAVIHFETRASELGQRVVLSLRWKDTGRRNAPLLLAVWLPPRGAVDAAFSPRESSP